VRAQVNAVLALVVMGFAILLALGFYLLSRRTRAESRRIQSESEELRLLNRRLSVEMAARRRVERTLKDAEQSLEQASKLAALGQMSAAVSHELNQPLAAMKTYLAGARLLLQRRRPDEALSSFQRIDDLIDRMGGITRQLKSYARKGDVDLEPVDLRDSVRAALSMMAPQLGKMAVKITTTLPSEPAVVMADPLRIEQIIVNLLRNALDAVRNVEDKCIKIFLVLGETILLSIEDNGPGLTNPGKLFEPFYTTKKPGEGLGLGLAISAGFAAELGGRLVARNAPDGGAVFELLLPQGRAQGHAQAAE
jgi:two-component system C4-dicarboxylate transport sensor histidine kinase DctB